MWGAVLSLLGGTVKGWLENRAELQKQKQFAKIRRIENGIPGWTDEFLVVIWSYPAVACFVPFLQPYAEAGIAAFTQLPDWYKAGFSTISAAVFGIDKVFRFKK